MRRGESWECGEERGCTIRIRKLTVCVEECRSICGVGSDDVIGSR